MKYVWEESDIRDGIAYKSDREFNIVHLINDRIYIYRHGWGKTDATKEGLTKKQLAGHLNEMGAIPARLEFIAI